MICASIRRSSVSSSRSCSTCARVARYTAADGDKGARATAGSAGNPVRRGRKGRSREPPEAGRSALHFAAVGGSELVAELLLAAHFPSPTSRHHSRTTGLHMMRQVRFPSTHALMRRYLPVQLHTMTDPRQ